MYPSKAVQGTTLCHTELRTKPRRRRSHWRVSEMTRIRQLRTDRAAGSQALRGQSTGPAASERSHRGSSCSSGVSSSRHPASRAQLRSNRPRVALPPIGRCGPPCRGGGGRSRQPPFPPPLEPAAYGTGDGGGAGGLDGRGPPAGIVGRPPAPCRLVMVLLGRALRSAHLPPPGVLALYVRPIPARGERRNTHRPSILTVSTKRHVASRISHRQDGNFIPACLNIMNETGYERARL